jgi:hypothetical protein
MGVEKMITEYLLAGIIQLCAVYDNHVDCEDHMKMCIPWAKIEYPHYQSDPDSYLEICIEKYDGEAW